MPSLTAAQCEEVAGFHFAMDAAHHARRSAHYAADVAYNDALEAAHTAAAQARAEYDAATTAANREYDAASAAADDKSAIVICAFGPRSFYEWEDPFSGVIHNTYHTTEA